MKERHGLVAPPLWNELLGSDHNWQVRRFMKPHNIRVVMNVLVVDIGGTHVKVAVTGQDGEREFASGPTLTPKRMLSKVRKLAADWKYDVVSIGYPGPVLRNRPIAEPWNLGKGWAGFNFEAAFKRPAKVVNDAAMQALGNYKRGKMLFLGLGTGLGSTLIVDGIVEPMELGHLPYKKATFEDYVGIRGLEKYGKKKWRRHVADVVKRLIGAIEPDEVVLGGGNVGKLKKLPAGCRMGDNANAFVGGFRLWKDWKPGRTHPQIPRPAQHIRKSESRTALEHRHDSSKNNLIRRGRKLKGAL